MQNITFADCMYTHEKQIMQINLAQIFGFLCIHKFNIHNTNRVQRLEIGTCQYKHDSSFHTHGFCHVLTGLYLTLLSRCMGVRTLAGTGVSRPCDLDDIAGLSGASICAYCILCVPISGSCPCKERCDAFSRANGGEHFKM